jgi:type II secretory pathway component PulC
VDIRARPPYIGSVQRLWVVAFVVGCGGAAPAPVVAPTPEPAPVAAPVVPVSQGTISRLELDAVLDQGLGRFLGRVTTEPHLEEGRFVGHRLTELRSELFGGVDLLPGDTLLRVNGASVERPEQALRVWNELHVASELTIDLLRGGERRQLRFAIVE